MDRAYLTARTEGLSKEPIVEMLIPSTLDDSLAPAGSHVASLFCQHFPYEVPGGWDARRDEAADHIIAHVDRYAPGFKASVIGRLALSPLDLERRFGLIGGDIFHGKMGLDQLFSNRPMLGHADYRMPLAGPLSVRRRRASRRRRHRRARPQCGARGARRPAEAEALTAPGRLW